MNKFLISALLLTSITIFSQELDEAYLESLPESVRDDVLKKIEDRDEAEKPVYRRKSSMVEKPEPLSGRFGDKIFNMMQSSFMPINEPNFDSSYILDFGDIIELQLVGQKGSIEELSIKRDGSINIPEVGKIFISGLPLGEVSKLIKEKVSAAYIGVEAFITLINVRDIQVLVTGNAFNPGIYTLNGNSNVLHALSMAGGIDLNGSYRQIDLIRDNKVISSIDLYDIFINGMSGFGGRLRSGDTILIRPYLKILNASGAFKRPGRYELKNNETFLDLIKYANGFSDNADQSSLRIERGIKDIVSYIDVIDIKNLEKLDVKSSDNITVVAFDRKTVTITGAINVPGTYTLSKGDKLSTLINRAQGYKDNAYPFGGILNNKRAMELNIAAKEDLYSAYTKELITKGSGLFTSETLPFVLEELKNSKVSGRIMAEFDLDVIKIRPDLDTTLDDGDEIIIPIKTEQVYIFGEVSASGALRYKPNFSINDYISNIGGTVESADLSNIFIIHPNGEIVRLNNQKFKFTNNSNNNNLIYPGSVIYIPRKVSGDPSLVASIWAPIISSAATSLAALSVLNK